MPTDELRAPGTDDDPEPPVYTYNRELSRIVAVTCLVAAIGLVIAARLAAGA